MYLIMIYPMSLKVMYIELEGLQGLEKMELHMPSVMRVKADIWWVFNV